MTDKKELAVSVVTSFPNDMWNVYAKKMLESYVAYWPEHIALLVFLDDDKLKDEVKKILRPQDAVALGHAPEHVDFIKRNLSKEHANDYRKQAVRFCHKVFFLKRASDYWKQNSGEGCARYLVWLDADVLTTRKVLHNEIHACLPREGDAVAYLGRKDWPHSECGWMAFDLHHGGHEIIENIVAMYESDAVFLMEQWHDSWVFDRNVIDLKVKATNLTEGKPGIEIWPHSPMAAWSRHYKGPVAKQELVGDGQELPIGRQKNSNIRIQTKNSIPDEVIQKQIEENQAQITQWIGTCRETDEPLIVVSAGPDLVPEDLFKEIDAGYKIVAVKHAIEPLKQAGITPWACILLDPRPHLMKFVENPDKNVIWFVASQVYPPVVKKLLDSGCVVWGYHAAVGAGEHVLTSKQADSVVSGGSATATRGLFMLDKLGFRDFRLYGYDLCLMDKPDLKEKDELGQPKYFEMSVQAGGPYYQAKKAFWTKPEFIAQFEEIQNIMETQRNWKIKAYGGGLIPFVFRAKEVSDLRQRGKIATMARGKPLFYEEMLGWPNKNKLSVVLHRLLQQIRRKLKKANSF